MGMSDWDKLESRLDEACYRLLSEHLDAMATGKRSGPSERDELRVLLEAKIAFELQGIRQNGYAGRQY